MNTILTYLPVLAVVVVVNILLGIYHSIGLQQEKFEVQLLIKGALKAGIIGASFMGLSYAFDVIDLSSLGVTPQLIMTSGIVLYTGKALNNLANILGVHLTTE